MNVTITRRSTVGFGYNTCASRVWNKSQTQSTLQVDAVTRPDFTGTILTVLKSIDNDRDYKNIRSGGTFFTTAWFVKINGQWRKIKDTDENKYELDGLTFENEYDSRERTGQKYYRDEAVVEVE